MTPIKSLNISNSNSLNHVDYDSEHPEEVEKKVESKQKSESDCVMKVYLNIG